jgi:ribosomal protein S18 acetylase RimI-like enzyme
MAGSFHIRSFASADESAVVALWRECELVVPQNDPAKDIRRKLQDSAELFLVAQLDDAIVGTVMAGYEGHRGWINYLAVARDCRRNGIGRQLMAAAEQRLRDLGCPKINLQVRTTNREVIAFYQSIGFLEDAVVSLGKRLVRD